jgi:hypothetical protein
LIKRTTPLAVVRCLLILANYDSPLNGCSFYNGSEKMNEFETENIIESYEMDKINALRSDLDKLRPKPYTWLIQWLTCLATIGTILYIAKVDLLVGQNFVWLLLLFVAIGFSRTEDYRAHKRIDLVIKLLDKNAFHKR